MSAKEYRILGIPQRSLCILGEVKVKILGNSNDFSVEFSTSSHTSSATKVGFLTTMFGGGILLLRGLRSQEVLEKLETDFWVYAEEIVTRLINSMRYLRE